MLRRSSERHGADNHADAEASRDGSRTPARRTVIRRRRRRRGTASLVLGAAALFLATGCGSSGSHGSLSVGVVYPFSGGSAFIGLLTNASTYPAVNLINADGGVLGHKLTVADIDTKNDPADAVPAVEQYVATTSPIGFVLGPGTTEAPTLVPILNHDKVVMQAGAGESFYNHNPYAYFWRLGPPDSENGVAMALYARHHGLTRVALVFGTDAGSQGDLPGVAAGAKALGLTVVKQVNLTSDQPSYESQAASVAAAKPQAIFTETDPTTAGTFYGEFYRLSSNKHVAMIGTQATVLTQWLNPVRSAVGATLFDKDYVGLESSASAPNPATAALNKALLADSAQVPKPAQYVGNPFEDLGYDQVIVTALAMVAAHSTKSSIYNSFISAVANAGPGKHVVYTYAQGVKLLAKGMKIQYVGAAGPIAYNRYHNSSGAQAATTENASGHLVVGDLLSASDIDAVNVQGVQ